MTGESFSLDTVVEERAAVDPDFSKVWIGSRPVIPKKQQKPSGDHWMRILTAH
jgi:hypothetical protein